LQWWVHNNMKNLLICLAVVLLLAGLSFGQTSLTQTSLAAAVTTSSTTTVRLTSATGVTAGSTLLYVDHEAMFVNAINSTTASVTRGAAGTQATGHISGSMVLLGSPIAFINYDPAGRCTAGQGLFQFSPVVNVRNGNQWLCGLLGKIVPGWGNTSQPAGPTAAVASAAGQITPSGPLFHITGALAITGFNIPVGLDPKAGQQMCVIPDAAFTTTAANNIALASTGVISKAICWTVEPNAAKPFFPSY
jgi:hypothetical protein